MCSKRGYGDPSHRGMPSEQDEGTADVNVLADQLGELKKSGPDALPAYVRNVRLKLFSEARRAILEVPHD